MTQALISILQERDKQIHTKGYQQEQDDSYMYGELSMAASCYALHSGVNSGCVPVNWPFDDIFWKPKSRRENLVRAAALLLAEIESLDRRGGAQ